MPSPNLIDASSESQGPGNKKVLRGDKAKKVLSKVISKSPEPKKRKAVKASEARKKMYGKE